MAERLRHAYEQELGSVGTFLPARVPATTLPEPLQPYLDACAELPLHYPAGRGGVRGWLERELPPWGAVGEDVLGGLEDFERDAFLTALSALAHAWRWDSVPPAPERFAERTLILPAAVDRPWRRLAGALDVPMVGSAWTLHLCNWRSATLPGGAAYEPDQLRLDDLDVAVQWLAPPYDGELRHFSLIFVLTEACAAPALRAAVDAIDAADERDPGTVSRELATLAEAIDAMRRPMTTFLRAPYVEPANWLDVIQPTMPWAAETADGIDAPGPNGLQVSSLQCLDATLGVSSHAVLAGEATAARAHMPPAHRRFLAAVDAAGPRLRRFVAATCDDELTWNFNDCIKALRGWRLVHQRRGARYLRSSRGENARVSTGLSVPWRQNVGGPRVGGHDVGEEDPVAVFESIMDERISETAAAALPVRARPGDATSVEAAFALLTADQRRRLLAVGVPHRYAPGDVLITEGGRAQPLQLVDSGEGHLSVGGRVLEAPRVRPGELVGEVSFLDGGEATASVVATTELEALVLTRDAVWTLLDDDPRLAAAFYRSLGAMAAQRLRALT